MTTILHQIASALDRLPLGPYQRAEIFAAWDVAPDESIPVWPHADADDTAYDDYCESPAGRAWRRVREYKMHRPGGSHYATDLDEASGYEPAPTKTEILTALVNAEHLLAGEKRAA